MTYPPKFGGNLPKSGDRTHLYPQALNLDGLDVYVEDDPNSPRFFRVSNLPTSIPYGKSYFTISFNDPHDTTLKLRDGSPILFEFKDSGGRVIFSDLTSYDDINGAALGYVWVKVDPLRTHDDIAEGAGTLTIVGELDDVPSQYKDVYNVRLTVDIDIRRDLPNNTPILFQSSSLIQEVLTVSESAEYDQGSTTYKRSLLNISASHLDTFGGQLKFIEVSYNEQISNADQFKLLTLYPVSASGEEYELTSSATTGLNPVSNFYKTPMPRDLRRGESVTFRLRFLNGAGQVAQDPTNGQDVIVSGSATFTGTPLVIEKDDNLITGSVGVGTEVGKGFKMSGESSAYIASADYLGFTSGSAGSGSGIILFSGSVFSDITDDYSGAGVGFEVVADSSSYMRFRTNPKELDIRADTFFVGTDKETEAAQFISASGGVIEITSSNFHLSSSGDVAMAGTITAEAGSIGGFKIEEGKLTSGQNNSAMTMSGDDRLLRFGSGSAFSVSAVDGILIGQDTDGVYKFAVGQPNSYIVFDGTSVSIKSDDLSVTASDFTIDSSEFKLQTSTLFISSSGTGLIAVGNPRPTGISADGNIGFFVDGGGNVLIGNASASRLQFDGTDLILSASRFFLGGGPQFISGSNGEIEISSSMFHLDPANNKVAISGSIVATDGTIGSFTIGKDALSSTNFFISGGATGNEYFISASAGPTQQFNVKASGDVTASSLLLTGGTVAGSQVTADKMSYESNWAISSSDNPAEVFISSSAFLVKQGGDVTGSKVLFDGGKIGGATIDDTSLAFGSNSKISSSDRSVELFISSSQFKVKQDGDVTASNFVFGDKAAGNYVQFVDDTLTVEGTVTADTILTPSTIAGAASTVGNASASIDSTGNAVFRSGSIGGFAIDATKIADSNNNLILKSSGQITASAMSMSGTVTADSGLIAGWEVSSEYISRAISGSNPDFSRVYLSTAINNDQRIQEGLIVYRKDEDIGPGEVKIVRVGGLSATDNLRATDPQDYGLQIIKMQDDGTGYENLLYIGQNTQQISGWNISKTQISASGMFMDSSAKKLVINKSTFGEDGIQLEHNSGNPRMYVGDGSSEFLKFDGTNLSIQTQDAHISGSSITLATPKFYLGESSNFISGSGGNIEISSSGFHLKPTGDVILSGSITAEAGQVGGFVISNNTISSSNDLLILKSSGQITGSSVFIGNHSGSRLDFNDNNLFISSSDFFMGSEAAFISASNGNIKITSSMFHLDPSTGVMALSGSITADDGQIGGFVITKDKIQTSDGTSLVMNSAGQITGSDVLFSGGTITSDVTIQGDLSATSISTPAGGSPKAIIDARGFAKFTSASIAGFHITDSFISASSGQLTLKSSGQITASAVSMSGTVTAESGLIGGFELGSNIISASSGNLILKSSGQITGSAVSMSGIISATGGDIGGFSIDQTTISSSNNNLILKSSGQITASAVSMSGTVTAESGLIGGFELGSNLISASSGVLNLKSSGQITASAVSMSGTITADGGSIGGFDISNNQFTNQGGPGTGVTLTLVVTVADNKYVIDGVSTPNLKLLSGNTYRFDQSHSSNSGHPLRLSETSNGSHGGGDEYTTGVTTNGTPGDVSAYTQIIVTKDTASTLYYYCTNHSGYGGTSNLEIESTAMVLKGLTGEMTGSRFLFQGGKISGSDIEISVGTASLVSDSGVEISGSSFHLLRGNITASNVDLSGKITATSGEIGGWEIGSSQITSSNLILDSAGSIETSDYESDVRGWRISSDNSGEAEFQNVKIRGTLSTTVFEKETVNAVGGQLLIANSTALTGSSTVSVTETTMSVTNVTGFSGSYDPTGPEGAGHRTNQNTTGSGDVLMIKKVSDTGFTTEYITVQSASRDFPSSATNFSGKLYVIRGYSGSVETDSGSVGDSPNPAQTYDPGQVLVSTGRSGSGYVRINANPNDTTTPYLDIVERTGSGIYDTELKARLGDLSGISSTQVGTNPGFGLFSENVFLTGKITATSGDVGGFSIDSTTVSSSNNNLILKSSGQITGSSVFFDDGKIGGFGLTNTSISSSNGNLVLKSSGQITASAVSMSGDIIATNITAVQQGNIGGFELGPSIISASSGVLDLKSSGQITASAVSMSGTITATSGEIGGFEIGPAVISSSNDNLILKSSGQITASAVSMSGDIVATNITAVQQGTIGGFELGSNLISASSGILQLNSSGQITASAVSMSGTVTAESGLIGGFNIGSNLISASSGNLNLKSSGQITASNALLSGELFASNIVATGSGVIGGFSIDPTTISSSNSNLILKSSGQITASAVSMSGDLIATNITAVQRGNIGGFSLDPTTISSSNSNLILKSSGQITASAMSMSGTVTAEDGLIGGFEIGPTTISASSGVLNLKSSGQITASAMSMSGTVTAEDGLIGGFILGSDTISASAGNLHLKSSGQITASAVSMSGTISADSGLIGGFGIGNSLISASSGVLNMKSSGQITASDALLSGNLFASTLTATGSGIIGGFVIGSDAISSSAGTLHLKSSGQMTGSAIMIGDSQSGSRLAFADGQLTISASNFYVGDERGTYISSSNNNLEISSSNLRVSASDFFIGEIGGRGPKIQFFPNAATDDTLIVSSSDFKIGSGHQYIKGQNSQLEISSSNFRVGTNGEFFTGISLSGSRVEFKNDTFLVSSSDFFLGSTSTNGYQYISGSQGNLVISASAFRVSASDFFVGNPSGSKLQFFPDRGGMQISSSGFKLGAGDHYISGSNSKLEISSSNFQIGTNGEFFVGESLSGSRVEFKNDKFILSSSDVFLGEENTAFISSSNGLLEISSSNFVLSPEGQVTASAVSMSGTITAESGLIGGFDIGPSIISASTGNLILNSSGQITGSAVSMSGIISAIGGDIGGFSIDGTTVSSTNSNLILKSSGQISASAVSMSGTVTADSGQIGGFVLANGGFVTSGQKRVVISSGQGAFGPEFLGIGLNADTFTHTVGTGILASGSGYFRAGNPNGEKLEFDGTNTTVSSSTFFLGSKATSFISASNGLLEVSSSNFVLDTQGGITASAMSMSGVINAMEGHIGGWLIGRSATGAEGQAYNATHDRISNVGATDASQVTLKGGASSPGLFIGDISTGNTGIQIYYDDSDDEAKMHIGRRFGPHITFAETEGLEVSASAFKIGDEGTQFISGSNGKIRISSSNFLVDDTGDFFVGESQSGSRIEFKNDAFLVSSSNFHIGETSTAFISGSNGNIQISASGFELDSKARLMTFSGSLQSSQADLGGFSVSASTISTDGLVLGNSTQTHAISASNASGSFAIGHDGYVEASNMIIDDFLQADYIAYRTVHINKTITSGVKHRGYWDKYLEEYTYSGKTYWRLCLDGSLGGQIGHMVRFDWDYSGADSVSTPTVYPIGEIKPPSYLNNPGIAGGDARPPGTNEGSGHTIYFESAVSNGTSGVYFANDVSSHPLGSNRYGFGNDSPSSLGNWFAYMWKDEVDTTGGVAAGYDYDNVFKLCYGNRIQYVKSYAFSFKPLAIQSYEAGPLFIHDGILTENGIAVGSTSLNATYELHVTGDIGATVDIVAGLSDKRLKENVQTYTSGSDLLNRIRPVEFDWNDKSREVGFNPNQDHETGFIAQELQEIFPEAVAPAPIDANYLTVKSERLIPILVSALKEQQNSIEELQEKLKQIEEKL